MRWTREGVVYVRNVLDVGKGVSVANSVVANS